MLHVNVFGCEEDYEANHSCHVYNHGASPTFHLLVLSSTVPVPVIASITLLSARCLLVISCWLR